MKDRIVILSILAILTGMILAARGADVTIAWDPPIENTDGTELLDLAGYEVVRGAAAGAYTWTSNVGRVTQKTFTGLTEGATYHWSVRAYTTDGRFSDYADELVRLCPDVTRPVIAPPGNRLLWVSAATEKAACPDLLVVTDNVTPSDEITVTQSPVAGTMLAVGNHSVKLTATDAAGNAAEMTATVKVQRRRPMPPKNVRVTQ